MDGHEPLAPLDEPQQRLLLHRGQRLVIPVDHQHVVVRQLLGGDRLVRREDVGQLNPPACERSSKQLVHRRRRVQRLMVPEEQDAQRPGVRFLRGCRSSRRRRLWRTGLRDE